MKTQEKTDREKAIEWWNKLSRSSVIDFVFNNFKGRSSCSLTGREIEQIWRKETQQELREDHDCCYPRSEQGVVFNNYKEKLQVDFKRIIETLDTIQLLSETEDCFDGAKDDILNIRLFFDLLSKSSTFAHKAHKELNKLMK